MPMQTAVRLALLKWLKAGPAPSQPPAAIPFISALSFNESAILSQCLRIPLTVSAAMANEVSILVPQMVPVTAFHTPPHTHHIQLKLAAACCTIGNGEALESASYNMVIPYNNTSIPAQTISLSLPMPANSITIVAAALEYYTNKTGKPSLCLDERFLPAKVIGGVVGVS